MKQISTLFIALFSMFFISCDEDVSTAIRLEGEWTGDMGMFYGFQDRYGRYYEVDAYNTNIRFYWDGDAYGHGEQIDYYQTGPYRYQSYYFQWRVIDGVIQMRYTYDSAGLDCDIYRWSMGYDAGYRTDVFYGYINNRTRFTLLKLTDFNGWNTYNAQYGYGYSYYDNYYDYLGYEYDPYSPYYYSKTRSESGAQPRVIKRGSRFAEATE